MKAPGISLFDRQLANQAPSSRALHRAEHCADGGSQWPDRPATTSSSRARGRREMLEGAPTVHSQIFYTTLGSDFS